MKLTLKTAVIIWTILAIGKFALATTYTYEGKTITKGQAMKVLLNNPKAEVFKIDQIVLNEDKMTLKNKPKD